MNQLQNFQFNTLTVRTLVREGEPWFVASDVCAALELSNPSKSVSGHVHEDDKSNLELDLPGKAPLVINESGLYALIFGSRKPEAKVFKRWVTSEVLPSIRKTGAYSLEQATLLLENKDRTIQALCHQVATLAPII
jgi:prophage antirepressor-like protein